MRHGYTIDDMLAIADAHGCSYGAVQQHLEAGVPLPPQRHAIKWPSGSEHAAPNHRPAEAQEPKPKKNNAFDAWFGKRTKCDHCGEVFTLRNRSNIYLHSRDTKQPHGLKLATICPTCSEKLLPIGFDQDKFARDQTREHAIDRRYEAICAECGQVHKKVDGVQTYIHRKSDTCQKVARYHCAACAAAWIASIKKSAPPEAPSGTE